MVLDEDLCCKHHGKLYSSGESGDPGVRWQMRVQLFPVTQLTGIASVHIPKHTSWLNQIGVLVQ